VRRLGCFGCFTFLILFALVAGTLWGGFQIIRAPDFVAPPTTKADGIRAQQKLFDFVRRGSSGRPRSMTLSEREVNAFLSRHLGETVDMPFRNLAVRLLGDARGEIAGQLPLRDLLNVAPLSALAGVLPTAWLDQPIWLSLRTRVTLEASDGQRDRRHLRLDVEGFWLGRLRLPEFMLRVLLDPAALRMLRWPVPSTIEGLRIEPGRLTVQSAS
jgi:hypothetical protein